jgi:hypothetical protein
MLTVVERDPEHHALKARALEALLDGELEWRHHGIGVLQAYLTEGEGVEHRLHIWSRSLLKPGINASGDAHDHRFDMVSHVLFGSVLNEEWHLEASPIGTWTTMTLVHARAAGVERKFHAPMTPTGQRYTRERFVAHVNAGERYHFPARRFHRSPVHDFAVTWVEKHNQTEDPAKIVHPIDLPAVPAFGHDTDPEQMAFLHKLAIEVLSAAP